MTIDNNGAAGFKATTHQASATSGDGGGFIDGTGLSAFARNSGTPLYLNRIGTTGYIMEFRHNGSHKGNISISSSAVTYTTSSDYRLKENVLPITDSIIRLKALKPRRFNFIADDTTTVDGFLAHEAATVVPEAVVGTKDAMMDEEYEVTPAVMDGETVVTEAVMGTRSVPDYQGIDQSKLVPLLVASLQEAIARIEVLEARVTALEV